MGIVHSAIYETCFGVVVFQRSMLNWRRGWGQFAIGLCTLCYIYMKLMWCNGFQRSMLDWRRG